MRTCCKYEDNIKTKVKLVQTVGVLLTQLVEDEERRQTFIQMVIKLKVPKRAENFLTMWDSTCVCFSRWALIYGVSLYSTNVSVSSIA